MKGPFCEYRDIFGKAGEGVHSTRLFGMAAVDLLMTIAFAIIYSVLTKTSFAATLIVVMVLGVIMHWMFCVPTTINTTLGLA